MEVARIFLTPFVEQTWVIATLSTAVGALLALGVTFILKKIIDHEKRITAGEIARGALAATLDGLARKVDENLTVMSKNHDRIEAKVDKIDEKVDRMMVLISKK